MILFLLNQWKYILIAALLAYGAFWQWRANVWEGRYETEKAAFQAFKSEVAAIGSAAEAKAKETKARQDTVTRKVTDDYKTVRNNVTRYYGSGLRLPADNSGRGVVPAAPDSAPRPDGATEERAPSEPSVADCALDAAQVLGFQQWIREQGIPVE